MMWLLLYYNTGLFEVVHLLYNIIITLYPKLIVLVDTMHKSIFYIASQINTQISFTAHKNSCHGVLISDNGSH